MKSLAALLFVLALEAVITEIGALNCTTCSYDKILTHNGTDFKGTQPAQEKKYENCYAEFEDDDYKSQKCDDSGLPSNEFRYTCAKLNGKTRQTISGPIVEVRQVQYRGCYPVLKTIGVGELTLEQVQKNLVEWYKTIPNTDPPTYESGNGFICDKDNCNSAVTFKLSGILCSFAAIITLLVNNL